VLRAGHASGEPTFGHSDRRQWCVVDAVAFAGVFVAFVSVLSTTLVALRAQRAAREDRDAARTAQDFVAYRSDQTRVVEDAMRLTTEVLSHVYAIEFHWRRGGPMGTAVADGGGPGAAEPTPISVTDFYGTNMGEFHAGLQMLEIAAYRIEGSTLREALLQYAKRVDDIRRFETLEEGAALRRELQQDADVLLDAGGAYIRSMFRID
jgi:hypothetical protein